MVRSAANQEGTMRNRGEAPGGALQGAGGAGREQLELWRGSQPALQRICPSARTSTETGAGLRPDPLQISLEVSGATGGGALAGRGRAP